GMEIGPVVSYDAASVSDFTTQITQIKAADVDVLMVTGYYRDGVLVAQAVETVDPGLDAVWGVANGAFDLPQFPEEVGEAGEGYFDANYHPDMTNENMQALAELYEETHNDQIRTGAVLAYDAVHVLAAGLESAGEADGQKVRDAIAQNEVPTPSLATARSSSTRRARTSTPSRSSCRSRTEWSCRSTPSSSQRLRRSTRGSSNPMTQAPVIDDPGTRESTGPARWARVPWVRIGIVLAVIAAAVVAAYARSGSTVVVTQAVVTGILIGGVYGLVAMGLTLIFGVLDIVNFAHGSFLAVALFL